MIQTYSLVQIHVVRTLDIFQSVTRRANFLKFYLWVALHIARLLPQGTMYGANNWPIAVNFRCKTWIGGAARAFSLQANMCFLIPVCVGSNVVFAKEHSTFFWVGLFFGQKYWSWRFIPNNLLKVWAILGLQKNFGPQKCCCNFSENIRFFSSKFCLMIMTFGNFPHTLGIWGCVEKCQK